MKKLIALVLILALCLPLYGCSPLSPSDTITYNDDCSEFYYKGHTYINYNNTNGKYHTNPEDPEWVKIATIPYGFFYILGAVTIFYGNNVENPDFITNSRTTDFYVREDITFDHSTQLSLCDGEVPFHFIISEITTENVIKYVIG